VFAVTVKEVKSPEETKIDDELAKKLGLDDLSTLKARVREQLESDYKAASRLHLKRRVLDALDDTHDFPLPPAMVEHEFTNIWAQVEEELKREGKTAADEGKTEDELKAEYRKIAERRVRLGLVLGKLGEQNGITIAGDEVQRAIMARARQFPARNSRCSSSMPRTSRPRPRSARPCSRTRWWTSSPSWPPSMTQGGQGNAVRRSRGRAREVAKCHGRRSWAIQLNSGPTLKLKCGAPGWPVAMTIGACGRNPP
jgi:head-tail adaptor